MVNGKPPVMQWAPGAPLDRGALKAASKTYVRHLMDGAHEDMGVLVVVVNRKTGATHWASSLSEPDSRAVLEASLRGNVSPIAIPIRPGNA